jgi:hypothetical protein
MTTLPETDQTPAVIGTFSLNGRVRRLSVVRNPSGTWTAGGPHAMRDFKTREGAVGWLKRVFANPGYPVTWSE